MEVKRETERIFGSELREGDTIEVWWAPNRDTITHLSPYIGTLQHLFPKGARCAAFALNGTGMTIDNGDLYLRIIPVGRISS